MADLKRKNEELNQFMVLLDGMPNLVEPEFRIDTYRIGVTKLAFADGILTVWLRRPGLLIGKGGSTIKAIEERLGCKIAIEEVRELWD